LGFKGNSGKLRRFSGEIPLIELYFRNVREVGDFYLLSKYFREQLEQLDCLSFGKLFDDTKGDYAKNLRWW